MANAVLSSGGRATAAFLRPSPRGVVEGIGNADELGDQHEADLKNVAHTARVLVFVDERAGGHAEAVGELCDGLDRGEEAGSFEADRVSADSRTLGEIWAERDRRLEAAREQ